MSKRFYFDEFSEDIFDDEIQQYPSNQTICNILNQQQEQIADLEAKLAKNKKWLASNEGFLENQQLKQQLAEKEKENMALAHIIAGWNNHNQDKIEFAVERLEKVKEELEFTSNNNEWITARDDRILNGICNFINTLISDIKGE